MDDGDGALVLVVDDDEDFAELTQLILEERGFSVVRANNGQRALAQLEAMRPTRPAAIVTDLMMPVLDGLGFLRAYARWPARSPVLAVSGFRAYLDQARKLGATATLAKPYSPAQLLAAVDGLLDPSGAAPAVTDASDETQERARVQAVLAIGLDERAPEHDLDEFVARVARHFEVKTCLVSIVTASRQLWHAGCGMPVTYVGERGSPREISFCTHAVAARAALIVQDATDNPLFRDNPFVTSENVRFYAGVPLLDRGGMALGTLCILDARPRVFGRFDLELLSLLAHRVVYAFERRDQVPTAQRRFPGFFDDELGVLGREAMVDLLGIELWRAAIADAPITLALVDGVDDLAAAARALERRFERGWIGRVGQDRLAVVAPRISETAAFDATQDAVPGARVLAEDVRRYTSTPAAALSALESIFTAPDPPRPRAHDGAGGPP